MSFLLNTTAPILSRSCLLCHRHSSANNQPPSFLTFPVLSHIRPVSEILRLQNSPSQNHRHVLHINCVKNDESDLDPQLEPSSSLKEAQFDINLPRRSMLVQFTCNSCGQRTERLINKLAYERGTVFVQCAGCLIHHRLVDNLGLVVEYDLRDEVETDSNCDNGFQ